MLRELPRNHGEPPPFLAQSGSVDYPTDHEKHDDLDQSIPQVPA